MAVGDHDAKRIRRLAMWAFGLGIVGLLTTVIAIGPIIALAGIVCGVRVIVQRDAWQPHDRHGFAFAGLLFAVAALLIFPLLLATAIPHLVARERAADARVCRENIERIVVAKQRWAELRHATNGARIPTNELYTAQFFPSGPPKCPSGGEYRVNPFGVSPECTENAHRQPRQ